MRDLLTAAWRWLTGTRPRAATTGAVAGGSAAVLAATVAFVAPWEGQRTNAYLDRIASPPVWTVCYGETRGVGPGDRYTPEQCRDMLRAALAEYRREIERCVPALPQQPDGVQVALTSWTYNVGAGAACRSTLARLANAGDWRGACDQLLRWNMAGGRVIPGLTNRRVAEHRLCTEALE